MMIIGRRRSGAHRSGLLSPKPAGLRRSAIRAPAVSRLAAPLPTSLTTGRHSTLGHSGCPTLNKTTALSSTLRTITETRSSTLSASSVRPSRQTTVSVPTQRFSTTTANKTVAAPPRPRPIGRTVPVAARHPSELTLLKEKITRIENERDEKDKQLKMSFETIDMQKMCLDAAKQQLELAKQQLEMTTMQLSMQKQTVETQKEQVESTKKEIVQEKSRNKDLGEQLDEKERILRKLHNDVVDLRGQIRVAVRVRPLLKTEESSASAIEYPAVNAIVVNQGSKSSGTFTFEKVFTPVFSQEDVFTNIEDFILSALHGYNVGLIAFGQTGSGKTHTMRGGESSEEGIIPRAASYLFRESKKLESIGWKFEFSLSFLEIYNNEAYDLLNNHAPVKLRLSNNTVTQDGLSEHPLVKLSDMAGLLRRADGSRKTAATKCNEYSSRSHAIYMWQIKANQQSTGISTSSVLKLVDLAGSERAKESGVVGQQFKEMTSINQSLSVLQKCINMQKAKSTHVPYRDSKLTQVLMDCLGRGNSKTMVMVNINPCNEQATESKRSIEFATKMRETHIGSAVQQRDLLGDKSRLSNN